MSKQLELQDLLWHYLDFYKILTKKSLAFEEVGNIFQLWNVVLSETTIVLQKRKHVVKFSTRMRGI